MNEIRKNYETEVEILRIKFKIPAVIIIKMLVSFITLFASGMVLVFRDTDASRLVGGILLAISFCFVLVISQPSRYRNLAKTIKFQVN